MDGRTRKRQASDAHLGQSDAPKAKRRKKPSSHVLDPESSSSTQISTSTSKLSLKAKKPKTGPVQSSASTVAHDSASSPSVQGSSGKTTKPRKKNHLKPQNRSWMSHIASILIYRCVSQARERSFDPRGSLKEFKWDASLSNDLLTPDDLQMIWFFIEREYSDKSLEDVSEDLKPFSKLTMEPFLKEEMKEKYKGEVPKPPLSAYLLFCKSKGAKLKEKHPDYTRTQMTQALGKRWKSLGAERQAKYKEQYTKLREEYMAKLNRFYEEHPDANPSAYRSRRRDDSKVANLTPEERRLKMLKSERPKPPPSAYQFFCKAKREKVQQKHPELSTKEVTTKLANRWKSMEEVDKIKYQRMHRESSDAYRQELRGFYEKYPDAEELLQRKRKRKDSGSATAVSQERTRRDSLDTFCSSDEEAPLKSAVTKAPHTQKREKESDSQGDKESSSSGDDEEQGKREIVERNKVIKERGGGVNERGTGGKSESETESDSSSSSEDEDEGKRELNGKGGGVAGKKCALTPRNSVKEKGVSSPAKKTLTTTLSKTNPVTKQSSTTHKTGSVTTSQTLKTGRATNPSLATPKPGSTTTQVPASTAETSSSESSSSESGDETDLSDFI